MDKMGIINLMSKIESIDDKEQSEIVEDKDGTMPLEVSKTDDGDTTKHIVLDGPLSHIYTKALNMTYANEAIASSFPLDSGTDQDESDATVSYMLGATGEVISSAATTDDTGMYVYCCSSDLDQASLIDASDKLNRASREGYSEVMLVMESDGVVSPKAGLLDKMSSVLGVKVCYGRNTAIAVLKGIAKGKT
jgi:hypothetical protein